MFFDNASTTKIDDNIIRELIELNDNNYYNAGAIYSKGRESRKFIDSCRDSILNCLNASEHKVIFTGSATEANNLALRGVLKKNIGKILVSMGEHPSVYNTALEIKSLGYDVEFVNLDKTGKVDFDDFKSKMTKDVGLISIMHVSNETGAVNNIYDLVQYAKNVNPRVIFHSDGVQAVGKIEVDIEDLGVDMYTMSAHKIHGMKGSGALVVNNKLNLKPIIFGGGQEYGIRSGTENLIAIATLSKAIEIATKCIADNYKKVAEFKKIFLDKIIGSGIACNINSFDDNTPYIVSISFVGCRAETLLNMLDDKNIYVGNGSACSSKNSGNRILESMGLSRSLIEGNLRISFSKFNTLDEVCLMVDCLIDCVKEYVTKVR